MHSAIVHDWLVSPVGGGEKALEAIHRLFPSPIYTLVQNQKKLKGSYFESIDIHTSLIQKLPKSASKYRSYLPLFPYSIEQFDLSQYDLVLSSSHCVAKGAITNPEQLHICYCYTPVRYAWDLMHEYLTESNLTKGIKSFFARWALHYLRGWDVHASNRVDHFVAISNYVAARICKFYGRSADVIYPPVDINFYSLETKKEPFYLAASRFVPYKKMGLIIEAFSKMPDKKLFVIGDGPEWKKYKDCKAKNVELLGYQSNEVLKSYMQRAKAFVFAAIEDFGILPVEAMAAGTPVIAFGKGAIKETVINGKTGYFFHTQTPKSLMEAVIEFEKLKLLPQDCRNQAEKFSYEHFNRQFQDYVLNKYSKFKKRNER